MTAEQNLVIVHAVLQYRPWPKENLVLSRPTLLNRSIESTDKGSTIDLFFKMKNTISSIFSICTDSQNSNLIYHSVGAFVTTSMIQISADGGKEPVVPVCHNIAWHCR